MLFANKKKNTTEVERDIIYKPVLLVILYNCKIMLHIENILGENLYLMIGKYSPCFGNCFFFFLENSSTKLHN